MIYEGSITMAGNKPKAPIKRKPGVGRGSKMDLVRAKAIRDFIAVKSPNQKIQPSAVDDLRGATNVAAAKALTCFLNAKKVKYDPSKTGKYQARLTEHDVKETLKKCFQ